MKRTEKPYRRGKNPFRESLESGHFAVTAELTPPRSASLDSLTIAVNALKPAVTAINLNDGAAARVRMSSMAAAVHVKQMGVEPILQVTCRDRNRIALQSDLLGAAAFGIRNVLVLKGDAVEAGDDPDAKPVFDLDSRQFIAALKNMSEKAVTLSGSELTSVPEFFRGAADTPFEVADDWTPDGLQAKLDAGAQFVQTQYCFDMRLLEQYMSRLADHGLTEKLYFLVGLGPLRSANGARWMRDNLAGTVMPGGIIRRMEAARDARQEGICICAELLQQARDINGIAGAHLMAPGLHQEIVEAVRLAGMVR
ncbi:MAG: methylenetetrahydrofolate reductase [Proteobacteria bacterium]|nr:methylenetetrahydrofolate reductase [Pseudomonadota bacterium]